MRACREMRAMYICNESGAGVTVRTPHAGALRVREGQEQGQRHLPPPPAPLVPSPCPGSEVTATRWECVECVDENSACHQA